MQYEGATSEGGKSPTIWDHFSLTYPGLSDYKNQRTDFIDTSIPTKPYLWDVTKNWWLFY